MCTIGGGGGVTRPRQVFDHGGGNPLAVPLGQVLKGVAEAVAVSDCC